MKQYFYYTTYCNTNYRICNAGEYVEYQADTWTISQYSSSQILKIGCGIIYQDYGRKTPLSEEESDSLKMLIALKE